MNPIYDIDLQTIDGRAEKLGAFAGKAMLVVNVASRCGFTPQYEGLEALYRRFRERGLVVLGFPCDQFGHQEPGSEAQIQNFCTSEYDVTFPLFAKTEVNGEANASALSRAEKRGERAARHAGDQVEFHEVPDRQGGPSRAALRADGQAGESGQGYRAAAGVRQ